MSNDQLIVDMLRSIQGRLGSTDGAIVALRSEIQHLSRRIDNLVGTSLLRLDGSRNESAGMLNELTQRIDRLERGIATAPNAASRATAKKAPKKAAARKAPARKAAAKRKPAKKGRR